MAVLNTQGESEMDQWKRFAAGLCLLLSQAAVHGEPEKQAAEGRGPYEGVVGSETAVWVVDTRTGRVRKCTQEFSDQTPNCSSFSR
jgi:hypothetical protein